MEMAEQQRDHHSSSPILIGHRDAHCFIECWLTEIPANPSPSSASSSYSNSNSRPQQLILFLVTLANFRNTDPKTATRLSLFFSVYLSWATPEEVQFSDSDSFQSYDPQAIEDDFWCSTDFHAGQEKANDQVLPAPTPLQYLTLSRILPWLQR